MSILTAAQLTTENNAAIISQVNPDTITQVTAGQLWQDIIDSMVNQNDLLINGVPLSTYITNIVTPLIGGGTAMDINAFRATKTVAQDAAGAAATGYKMNFEDDTTAPNLDNGNCFYTNEYVFKAAVTKRFVWEKQKVISANTGTYKLRILKNGVEVAASETITTGTVDVYGNTAAGTGYQFLPFYIDINGAYGDVITWEVYCITTAGTAVINAQTGGVISNC